MLNSCSHSQWSARSLLSKTLCFNPADAVDLLCIFPCFCCESEFTVTLNNLLIKTHLCNVPVLLSSAQTDRHTLPCLSADKRVSPHIKTPSSSLTPTYTCTNIQIHTFWICIQDWRKIIAKKQLEVENVYEEAYMVFDCILCTIIMPWRLTTCWVNNQSHAALV